MRIKLTLFFIFLFSFSFAQTPVRAPRKNGVYEKNRWGITRVHGTCHNKLKTGTWKYCNSNGYLFKEEDFDTNGILIVTRTFTYNLKNDYCDMFSFVDGIKQGKYMRTRIYHSYPFSPTADSTVVGFYSNGKKNGEWNFYRKIEKEKNRWKKENWKSDSLISIYVYRINGSLFSISPVDSSGKISRTDFVNGIGEIIGTEFPGKEDSIKIIQPFNSYSDIPRHPFDESFFYRFLYNNVSYPQQAKDSSLQGTVYVSFDVNYFGAIENIQVLNHRDWAADLENEAVRVIEMMPPMELQPTGGEIPKKVKFNLPVKFKLG
jgi:TonB family protein